MMVRASSILVASCALGALACSEQTQAPSSAELPSALASGSKDDFLEPPANAPPPPASCGDQNGGGDQHVDFDALMAQKVAEKPAAMARQLELLNARYDLSDVPANHV